jgi:hypothetical protein
MAPKFSFLIDWYYGKLDETAKGFFCSQLVANAYHHTNVLDPKIKKAEAYGCVSIQVSYLIIEFSPSDFGILLNPEAPKLYLLGTDTLLFGDEEEIEFIDI